MAEEIVRRLNESTNEWETVLAEASSGSLPSGGTTGEVLTKLSNAEGDADWEASGGGSQDVYVARAYLDNAAIIALPTTPIQLAPAPGAGQMIWPQTGLIYVDCSAGTYGGIDASANMGVCLGALNGPGDFLNYVWEASSSASVSALFVGGDPIIAPLGPQAVEEAIFGTGFVLPFLYQSSGLIDQPLMFVANNGGANYEDGDPANFMVVGVTYSILDMTAP